MPDTDVEPGSIVEHNGQRRTVIDVAVQDAAPGEERHAVAGKVAVAVLRPCDDDPERRTDAEGGDLDITAAYADELTVVGHI